MKRITLILGVVAVMVAMIVAPAMAKDNNGGNKGSGNNKANTVKHAQADGVELRLEQDAGETILEVRDDGGGFDPEGSFPGHLGLKSMRERVARLGGTLRIESAPGEGTRVRAQIPPGTT